MGKTTDLFKKIRDTKGTFHAKMGSMKDSVAELGDLLGPLGFSDQEFKGRLILSFLSDFSHSRA